VLLWVNINSVEGLEEVIQYNLFMGPFIPKRYFSFLTTGSDVIKSLGINIMPTYIWNYKEYIGNRHVINKVAGTYAIYNPFSGKVYVGSAGNLKSRLNVHYTNPLGSNKPLQRAFIKYGKYNFQILIFHFIINPPATRTELIALLKPLEDYLLHNIDNAKFYNIQKSAYSAFKLAVHDLSLIKDKSWTFTKIKDFWGSLF
jgi:hypothetical protein